MWKRSRKTSWQNDIIQENKLHTVEKTNRNLEASKGTGTEISIHRRDMWSQDEPSEERRLEREYSDGCEFNYLQLKLEHVKSLIKRVSK